MTSARPDRRAGPAAAHPARARRRSSARRRSASANTARPSPTRLAASRDPLGPARAARGRGRRGRRGPGPGRRGDAGAAAQPAGRAGRARRLRRGRPGRGGCRSPLGLAAMPGAVEAAALAGALVAGAAGGPGRGAVSRAGDPDPVRRGAVGLRRRPDRPGLQPLAVADHHQRGADLADGLGGQPRLERHRLGAGSHGGRGRAYAPTPAAAWSC